MDGEKPPMGILDLYIQPPVIDDEQAIKDFKEYARQRLTKGKSKLRQQNCVHEIEYEKWVYYFKNGGKSFHYKEICRKCGYRRHVERTKEVYEAVKDQKWHHGKYKD